MVGSHHGCHFAPLDSDSIARAVRTAECNAGTAEGDVGNFTSWAPYPIVHLLRQSEARGWLTPLGGTCAMHVILSAACCVSTVARGSN
jgi:hypothetical protein